MASLCFASCQKEKLSSTDRAIIGQWKWIVSSGSAPWIIFTLQSTGKEGILTFDNHHNWVKLENNIRADYGTYKTVVETTSRDKQVNSIQYYSSKDGSKTKAYYEITDSTLVFSNDFGGSIGDGRDTYKKQ